MNTQPPVRVQVLHVPDCPLLEHLRANLRHALAASEVTATVHEQQGTYPSPTVLVNGLDITTSRPPGGEACCRLDVPTADEIAAALRQVAQS